MCRVGSSGILGLCKVEAGGQSSKKQQKRNACEGCYSSRVKCIYLTPEDLSCARCERQGRECAPRVVLRGRAREQAGLNALASDELAGLNAHFGPAASLVATYKAAGFDKAPVSVEWTLNLVFSMAVASKSMNLLHTGTTMATTMTDSDVEMQSLFTPRPLLSPEARAAVLAPVRDEFLLCDDPHRAYIVTTVDSANGSEATASPTFEHLFAPADTGRRSGASGTGSSGRCSAMQWRNLLQDSRACERASAEMAKACVQAGEPSGFPRQVSWFIASDDSVTLRDKHGNRYSAQLFLQCHLVERGALAVMVFGFQDITPLNDSAARRITTMQSVRGGSGSGSSIGSAAGTPQLGMAAPGASNPSSSSSVSAGSASSSASAGSASAPAPMLALSGLDDFDLMSNVLPGMPDMPDMDVIDDAFAGSFNLSSGDADSTQGVDDVDDVVKLDVLDAATMDIFDNMLMVDPVSVPIIQQ